MCRLGNVPKESFAIRHIQYIRSCAFYAETLDLSPVVVNIAATVRVLPLSAIEHFRLLNSAAGMASRRRQLSTDVCRLPSLPQAPQNRTHYTVV